MAAPGQSVAATAEGVVVAPSEISGNLPGARLSGAGRFRYFGLAVYDARLWVASAWTSDDYAQRPFALELLYRRDLAGRAIAERSLEEMRRVGAVTAAQAQLWLVAMQAAFPDVRDGDRLTGLHRPGAATQFFLNGALTREVADTDFAPLFFGIWLSPRTSAAALRRALLGQAVTPPPQGGALPPQADARPLAGGPPVPSIDLVRT